MIKKIIIMTVSLFVVYTVLIYVIRPATLFQHVGQISVVKVQDFVFGAGKKYIIVGSSLSSISLTSQRPEDNADLSFPGASIYDGLEIIKKSGFIPRVIFVEANYFHKISYKIMEMNTTTFMPAIFDLKKNIPSLQEKYQPMNVLIPCIIKNIYAIKKKIGNISNDDKSGQTAVLSSHSVSREKSVFKEFLKLQMDYYNKIPDKQTLDVSVNKLREYTKYFEDRGVKIIFFEMPVDTSLCSAPLAVYLRTSLRKQFKPGDYDYIPMPDCSLYKTGDGIHLDPESVITYKNYYFKEVDKIFNKGAIKNSSKP